MGRHLNDRLVTSLYYRKQGGTLKYGCCKATRNSLAYSFDNITPFLERDDEVLARLEPNKYDAETPVDSDDETLMLIQKRLKDESAEHDQQVQTHEAESRLTNLLASNGLQKWPVSADGDCLLSAVSLQVPELGFSDDQLREEVCEHISLYSAHYAPFLSHSCMESDSMNSAIETAKRTTQVHVPSQWDTVIRLARKKKTPSSQPLEIF